jgi:hypothetical protein
MSCGATPKKEIVMERELGDIRHVVPGPVVQPCWVVDDIPSAVERWVRSTGAGPFFLAAHIEFAELTYRAPIAWAADRTVTSVRGDRSVTPDSAEAMYSWKTAATERADVPFGGSRFSWATTCSRANAISASLRLP